MGSAIGAFVAILTVGLVLGLAYWSNRKAERRQEAMRRTIIDTTTRERPTLQRPKPGQRRTPKPKPAPPNPTHIGGPVHEDHVPNYAEIGIMDAQYMLDCHWKAKGYDGT